MAGAISIQSECPVCWHRGEMELGFIGMRCPKCRRTTSGSERHQTVRYRRELLGLSRTEMARLCGVLLATVARYEGRWPSEAYWRRTGELVYEYMKGTVSRNAGFP